MTFLANFRRPHTRYRPHPVFESLLSSLRSTLWSSVPPPFLRGACFFCPGHLTRRWSFLLLISLDTAQCRCDLYHPLAKNVACTHSSIPFLPTRLSPLRLPIRLSFLILCEVLFLAFFCTPCVLLKIFRIQQIFFAPSPLIFVLSAFPAHPPSSVNVTAS